MVQTCNLPKSPKQAASLVGVIDELLVAELFRALGDRTRNKLLSCLAKCGRACSVGEVAECCAVDMSVVSRHLSILEAAEILESHKKGRTVYYIVRYAALSSVFRDLANAFEDCSKGKSKLVATKKVRGKRLQK